MKRYIVFSRITANDTNMQSAWWTCGFPGIHAFFGFAENFARRFGYQALGVSIIHHDAELRGEKPRSPSQPWGFSLYKGASAYAPLHKGKGDDYSSKSEGVVLSSLPVIRGRICCSLILEYDDNGYSECSDQDILKFVNSGRCKLAGGDIHCPQVFQPKDLEEAKSSIKGGGFQLVDRADIVERTMQVKGVNAVEALLMAVSRRDASGSWLFPLAIGYHGISELALRVGSREENVPHAFVEPLVGLVQCVSLRQARSLAMWRPVSDVPNLLFYFKEN